MHPAPADPVPAPYSSASDQRWRLLFEQSPLSIQIFAPDGQTIRFNQAWSNLFGLTPEQGYAFNPLKDPDLIRTGAVAHISRAFRGEAVIVPPVPFPVAGDPPSTRWIGGTLYPVTDPDGALLEVVVIHHDITELKEAEETTRRLNEILEERVATRTAELSASEEQLRTALDAERQINLLKTSFVGMVSHEFRTPLGIISTATELLSRHHDKLAPDQRGKYHESIMGAVKRMTGMMEHILLLARIDSGNVALALTEMDLSIWLPMAVEELKSSCPSKDYCPTHRAAASRVVDGLDDSCPIEHTVILDIAPSDALRHAWLDESLLHHIVGNLLSNACKYSPSGSLIQVTLAHRHPHLVLTIQDHGAGIPEDEQAHLFDGFFRGSNVGNTPGTGLGLAITQRCVELLGGSISLWSRPGNGTVFTVILPITPP